MFSSPTEQFFQQPGSTQWALRRATPRAETVISISIQTHTKTDLLDLDLYLNQNLDLRNVAAKCQTRISLCLVHPSPAKPTAQLLAAPTLRTRCLLYSHSLRLGLVSSSGGLSSLQLEISKHARRPSSIVPWTMTSRMSQGITLTAGLDPRLQPWWLQREDVTLQLGSHPTPFSMSY